MNTKNDIDVVFVIDETGSMGSYLESVKKNVKDIVRDISHIGGCGNLRFVSI